MSFQHASRAPSEIAKGLSERGVFVWNGHNYALEVVRQLGIPEDVGLVRIGIAHYNTEAEVDATLEVLASLVA